VKLSSDGSYWPIEQRGSSVVGASRLLISFTEAIVCALAKDVDGRKERRKSQRAAMMRSPLCDAKGLARSLEDAIESMYAQWRSAG